MHLIVAQLMFILNLHTGIIIPDGDVDGRRTYSIPSANIEYAYKAEILEYIDSGDFEYNEDL